MDKESGVYIVITDNTFETTGVSSMQTLIPMLTTKGEIGLNTVNINNFKDVLGYDLDYNSNYYGLSKILSQVSTAKVWRINQDAKLANAYFLSKESGKLSEVDAETFDDITHLDPGPILALALKNVGNPQTTAVKFTPVPNEETVVNESPLPSNPQTIVFDDVSETETSSYNNTEIKGGCIFYNSSDNTPVGIIKANKEGELTLYKIVDGNIVDDVYETISNNTWTDGTNFFDSSTLIMEEPEGEHTDPVEIGDAYISTYPVENDAWALGSTYFNENVVQIIPEGTPGTPSTLCEGYIATDDDSPLLSGRMYITNNGTDFALVSKLAKEYASITSTTVEDSEAIAKLVEIYNATKFVSLNYVEYTEDVSTGFYNKKVLTTGVSWFKISAFSKNSFVTEESAETDETIINALSSVSPITISFETYSYEVQQENNSQGTATWDESKLTIEMTKTISKDSFWNVHIIPSEIINWKLTVASYANSQYTIISTQEFSTDSESDTYWENITFSDVDIYISGNIYSNWDEIRSYFTLDNGSNGNADIIASDLDVSVLEKSKCNVLAMNGITNYKVVNKIAEKGEDLFIHTFADAPAYEQYADLELWKKNLYSSEYLAIGSRPDQVEIDDGKYIYVYPSVNYVAILANMQDNYGSLMYPPAGYTYGTISVEDLIECDYENYGDELKTNRINWQRTKNRGSVMWEQRTTYSGTGDLSYIAPTFIVDGLREQIQDFEESFNFRYTSPTDLLNQESGLKSILDDYVEKNFVYQYTLEVPTYAEAQTSRTLTIKIGVVLGKDAEVITINVNLNNA